MSDDGIINNKKGKKSMGNQSDLSVKNSVIKEGQLGKFLAKSHNVVKRYVVLNQYAFFVYKDDMAFKTAP